MRDPAVIRANERIKASAGTFFNLGTALIAALAAKLFYRPELDLAVAIWTMGAAALIWVGWKALGLLESED